MVDTIGLGTVRDAVAASAQPHDVQLVWWLITVVMMGVKRADDTA